MCPPVRRTTTRPPPSSSPSLNHSVGILSLADGSSSGKVGNTAASPAIFRSSTAWLTLAIILVRKSRNDLNTPSRPGVRRITTLRWSTPKESGCQPGLGSSVPS